MAQGRHRGTRRVLRRRRLIRALTLAAAAAAVVAPFVAGQLRTREAARTEPAEEAPAPPMLPSSPSPSPDPLLNLVAEAIVPTVPVLDAPDGETTRRLANPTEVGAPLVFLVEEEGDEWLRVLLPIRPNGSTGWVRTADVRLTRHRFRIEVERGRHRLRVWDGEDLVLATAVAIGTRDTPTPGGRFYVKELLQPPDPDSVYGTYAYGLSGFSNVLRKFNGGNGVIGIHGTNDPSVIGTDVSAGCIRMTNEAIEELVPILPLGTPVEILE